MSKASVRRQDPQEYDALDTTDFGRVALNLLTDLDSAHPNAVDLTNHNDVSIDDASLSKFWFYLAHQGIISGELNECALTLKGRQSLRAAFETQCESASTSLSSNNLLTGKSASSLLLDVMRHNFLLQADTP